MSSATTRVLTTYELLERILLHLPIHNLFQANLVSRTWHSLVQRATPIQQKLFLIPTGPSVKPIPSDYNYYSGRTRTLYLAQPLQLNPCGEILGLINQPSGRGHRIPLVTFGLSDQSLFLQFDVKGFPIYEERILSKEASWRGMLLTQPPIVAINFEFVRRDPHGGAVTVFNPQGVTFGDLHEMSLKLASEFEAQTGEDSELSFESVSFCLFHPFTDDQMEEAW